MNIEDLFLKKVKSKKCNKFNNEYIKNFSDNYLKLGYKIVLENRDYVNGFLARLLHKYTNPIHLLEIFIENCISIAQEFKEINGEELIKSNKYSYRALRLIHAKSLLNANEILCLIKNGFASAALARWRTLFENTIFAKFIIKNDNNTAKRYLDYMDIETYFECKNYQKYNIDDQDILKDLKSWESRKEELEKLYGSDFSKPLGWAIDKFKDNKGKNIKSLSLKKIIEDVESESMLPYYKFSNIPIHFGPKGLFYNIGQLNGINEKTILINKSNVGFTDPAQLMALNLYEMTMIFVSLNPNMENYLKFLFLKERITEIAQSFLKVENEIKKEEECLNFIKR